MSGDRERTTILEDLRSVDEEIRRLAVERLSSLPAREAIPRLVESLGDLSWRVRKAAVERLVVSAEAESVGAALIEALADGDNPGRRNSAVEALMACGPSVVPQLALALATDDIDVRKLVVDAMAGIGDPAARGPLMGALADPDTNVRAAAADALGVIGGAETAVALRSTAIRDDEDQLVRFSALRALARLEVSIPSSDLQGVVSDPVLRPAAFALLGACEDDGAEDQLLKGLASSSRASREAAMEALLARLGRGGPDAAERLAVRIRETAIAATGFIGSVILRLADADLATRLMIVQFLGLVGSPECVRPILEAARDEAIAEVAHATLEGLGPVAESALDAAWPDLDGELRRSACALFARMPGDVVNGRLLEALKDSDAELRAAAARALGARGSAESLADLVRRLESASQEDELEAEEEVEALVGALVELGSSGRDPLVDETVEQLASRLESPLEAVRRAAASVLAKIARPQDAERMAALLRDPSAQVRRLAVVGLVRLDPETAAEPMRLALADESPLVRMAAAFALGASPSPSVLSDLQRLLVDEDPRVAAAALRGIGTHCAGRDGEPCERELALHLLEDYLRASDRPGEGRGGMIAMAALEALEVIGGPDAGRAAVAALERPEPEVVQAAVGCVGRHGDRETLSELIAVVQHASWAVRGEAIQTLADRHVSRALPAILRRLETEQDDFVRDVIVRALRRLEE